MRLIYCAGCRKRLVSYDGMRCKDCMAAWVASVNETREARTIRRLRALASGYRARAERNGRAARARCTSCSILAMFKERARIVARLRERADSWWNGEYVCEAIATELSHFAELLESEEP